MSNTIGMISFTSSLGHIPPAVERPIGEITLTNLLQGSPEISKVKKNSSKSGSDNRLAGGSDFLSASSSLTSKYSSSRSTAVLTYSLETSKLAALDQPNSLEAVDIKSKRKQRKIRKDERERTKGAEWFNMKAPEITQERKNDLEALRLRGALDTKRFYKRNNLTHQPKYFQVGTIVEGAADYYNSRVPKRQRKKTLAEEMVAEISSTSRF